MLTYIWVYSCCVNIMDTTNQNTVNLTSTHRFINHFVIKLIQTLSQRVTLLVNLVIRVSPSKRRRGHINLDLSYCSVLCSLKWERRTDRSSTLYSEENENLSLVLTLNVVTAKTKSPEVQTKSYYSVRKDPEVDRLMSRTPKSRRDWRTQLRNII